jgi:hypothetical protein
MDGEREGAVRELGDAEIFFAFVVDDEDLVDCACLEGYFEGVGGT